MNDPLPVGNGSARLRPRSTAVRQRGGSGLLSVGRDGSTSKRRGSSRPTRGVGALWCGMLSGRHAASLPRSPSRTQEVISLRRTAKAAIVLLGASLLAAACGGDNKNSSSTTAAAPATTSASGATTAAGGAATTASGGADTTVAGATGRQGVTAVEQEPTTSTTTPATDNVAWTSTSCRSSGPGRPRTTPRGPRTNKDLLTADRDHDQRPADRRLQVEPEGGVVGRHAHRVDDFMYTWKVQNGVAPYTAEVTGRRVTQRLRGHHQGRLARRTAPSRSPSPRRTPTGSPLFGPILPAARRQGGRRRRRHPKGVQGRLQDRVCPPNLANVVSGGPYVDRRTTSPARA